MGRAAFAVSQVRSAPLSHSSLGPRRWPDIDLGLDGFVESCESALDVLGVRGLLREAMARLGFDRFLLATHAPAGDLGCLGVLLHNLPAEIADHLSGAWNPLFVRTEQTDTLVDWSDAAWRSVLDSDRLRWLNGLRRLWPGHGVSQGMRCPMIGASFSITSPEPVDPRRALLAMRIARQAYHHVQYIQRRALRRDNRLSERLREVEYRATVHGEPPRVISRALGLSSNTVQSHRRKLKTSTGAHSPEQAAIRMFVCGELFYLGRPDETQGGSRSRFKRH